MAIDDLAGGNTGQQLVDKFNALKDASLKGAVAAFKKEQGEPILLTFLGYSYQVGEQVGTTEPMPPVEGVKQWSNGGNPSAPLGWNDFDGDAPTYSDWDISQPYVGHPCGSRGNYAYALSKYLREVFPNNPVYIVWCAQPGVPLFSWTDGQPCEAALSAAVSDALQTPELSSLSAPDFVLMATGIPEARNNEGNFFSSSDKAFAVLLESVIENFYSKWADREITRWGIFEVPYEENTVQAYDAEGNPSEPWYWSGIYKAYHQIGDNGLRVFPLKGYPRIAPGDIHPDGDSCLQIGRAVGRSLVEGRNYVPAPYTDQAVNFATETIRKVFLTDDDSNKDIELALPIDNVVREYTLLASGQRIDGGGAGFWDAKYINLTKFDTSPQGASRELFEVGVVESGNEPTIFFLAVLNKVIARVIGVAGEDWVWSLEIVNEPRLSVIDSV